MDFRSRYLLYLPVLWACLFIQVLSIPKICSWGIMLKAANASFEVENRHVRAKTTQNKIVRYYSPRVFLVLWRLVYNSLTEVIEEKKTASDDNQKHWKRHSLYSSDLSRFLSVASCLKFIFPAIKNLLRPSKCICLIPERNRSFWNWFECRCWVPSNTSTNQK